jgi:phage baseplate assembly protein W
MSSTGFNRLTGAPLRGFDHVRQSLNVIFTTPLGSRVMRRNFGFAGTAILGRENLTPQVIIKFYMAIVIAVALWEPRFRVRRLRFPNPTNSPTALQQGRFGVEIEGDYLPNALQGDFTPEGPPHTVTV